MAVQSIWLAFPICDTTLPLIHSLPASGSILEAPEAF